MIDASSLRTTVYTSDLTDAEWTRIEPLLPAEKPFGRHRVTDLREVASAINYRDQSRLSLAESAHRFPAVGHGLQLLPPLEPRGHFAQAAENPQTPSRNAIPIGGNIASANGGTIRLEGSGIPQSILVQAGGRC